jgi:hypothetical protein
MSEIDDKDTLYFYLHTKGISHFKTLKEKPVIDWINLMLYWNITKWNLALENLKVYDTYGCNKVRNGHYSGNFWWARQTHIQTLQTYIEDYYTAPEDWIVKCKNAKHCSIFNSGLEGMGHYTNLYPKELYNNSKEALRNNILSRKSVGFRFNVVFNPDPPNPNTNYVTQQPQTTINRYSPARFRVK